MQNFTPDDLHRATVFDRDGQKVGRVQQVYLDDHSGRPSWVTVNTGFFGTNESLIPLDGAQINDDALKVPFDKQAIRDAPNYDPGHHLDENDENDLYNYYGIDGGAGYADDASRADRVDRDRDGVRDDLDRDRLGDDRVGDRDRDRLGDDRVGDRDRDRLGDDRVGDRDSRGGAGAGAAGAAAGGLGAAAAGAGRRDDVRDRDDMLGRDDRGRDDMLGRDDRGRDDMLGRDDRDRQDPTLARGGEHYADQQAQDARVAGGQQADQQRGTLEAGDVQDDSDHEREMLDRERDLLDRERDLLDRERSLNERGGGRPRLRRYSPGQQ